MLFASSIYKENSYEYFPIMPDNVGEQEPYFHAESPQWMLGAQRKSCCHSTSKHTSHSTKEWLKKWWYTCRLSSREHYFTVLLCLWICLCYDYDLICVWRQCQSLEFKLCFVVEYKIKKRLWRFYIYLFCTYVYHLLHFIGWITCLVLSFGREAFWWTCISKIFLLTSGYTI